MKIMQFKNIHRKDAPIYYRRFYTGTVVLDILQKIEERIIDFSVEMMPTGSKEIKISFDKPVDYPAVPLLSELKSYINDFDRKGGLPI